MDFPIHKFSFPAERWPMKEPPEFIYAQGSPEAFQLLELLPDRGFAIVGTRQPQPRAQALTRNVVSDLAGSGLVILSGLALGIDACAHESALDSGLPTVAILGCGLGLQYPIENQELRLRILNSGGLILSEYEQHQEARPHHFLNRNRLIAGFARATWIVQAPLRSGALNTATHARENDRDCYATPCFPGDPTFAGTQKLLDEQNALYFWGAHNLGKTWISLSNAGKTGRGKSHLALTASTTNALEGFVEQIRFRTAQSGGITVGDLLDWAISQQITPIECFERLQKAQQCGLVSEENGVVATTEVTH